jgi:hypothetical protein
MSLPRHRAIAALLSVCSLLALVALPGRAVDVVHLSLGSVEGAGWSARSVRLQLSPLDQQHAAIGLQAKSATLPAELGRVSDLELTCARARLTKTAASCPQGLLRAQSSELGWQRLEIAFRYEFESGHIEADLQGLKVHEGVIDASVRLSEPGWQLDARAQKLSLPPLTRQLVAAGVQVPVVEGSGRVSLKVLARGGAARLDALDVEMQLQADELSDAEGSLATEGLEAVMHASLVFEGENANGKMSFEGRRGALYVDPLYIEIPQTPLQGSVRFDWHAADERLTLYAFSYVHPDSLQMTGRGKISLQADMPVSDLHVTIKQGQFPSLFNTYLQPWLYDTGYAELDTGGSLTGEIELQHGALSRLSLDPRDLSVDDREGRFTLNAMNGQLRWSTAQAVQRSMLSWQDGSLFNVALGPAGLQLETDRDSLRLQAPAAIPVLDGSLGIDEFEMAFGDDQPLRWQVNGLLEPVSLSELSLALGWPELAGKLSGVIPNVRYDGGDLEVGGILLLRVFEGEITLRNLTLEQPFGLVPRLQVDARADNIDLETLTRTFSFGRIEGRLNGRIDGLDMESWRPVAFDAEFATPEDDRSRHRISQKAVDNISSIGGAGVSGALSRSFLRFFEDFPYDRLGIRCRLENGICDMGGVAPAADGYYLVKGRMIPPRLDVVGYADRVNWDTLIAQIMAVTASQDIVVE